MRAPRLLAPARARVDATTFHGRGADILVGLSRVEGRALAALCDGSRSSRAIAERMLREHGVDVEEVIDTLFEHGAAADVLQRARASARRSPQPRVEAVVSGRAPPLVVATAYEKGIRGFGVGATRAGALTKARAEAIERWAFLQGRASRTVRARCVDVAELAIRPSSILGRGLPRRFDEQEEIEWHEYRDLRTGESRLVPADLVSPRAAGRDLESLATSSGVAAHTSAREATRGALLELVERDAFMILWLNRLRRPRLLHATLPGEIGARVARIVSRGYEVHVVDATLDLAPVAVVVTLRRRSPLLTCAAGAGLDLERALAKAVGEAEQCTHFQLRGEWCGLEVAPSEVRTHVDHASLYRGPFAIRQASFLTRGRAVDATRRLLATPLASADELLDRLSEQGIAVLAAEIGGQALRRRAGLSVVRVVAPGLVPLMFGHGSAPIGLARVRAAPCAMGLRVGGEPNMFPHPFS